jgi:hypothetical protein
VVNKHKVRDVVTPPGVVLLLIIQLTVIPFSHAFGDYKQDRWSFFSHNQIKRSTTDFEEVDDTRNFTSEAVFMESAVRLNRALTKDELKSIARIKKGAMSYNVLRFRASNDTFFDFTYKKKQVCDGQITDFFDPFTTNKVEVSETGLAFQTQWFGNETDLALRGIYRYGEREGVIEFLPEEKDKVKTYEVDAVLTTGLSNSNELTIYPTFAYQDIEMEISNPYDRSRYIAALSLVVRYDAYGIKQDKQLKSYHKAILIPSSLERIFDRQYDYRNTKMHAGLVYDEDAYGEVDVIKKDLYVGVTFFNYNYSWTIEPSLYTFESSNDASQDNSQLRTKIVLSLYDAYDLPLVLSLPIRYDYAVDGPDYFESWRIDLLGRYDLKIGPDDETGLNIYAGAGYQEYFNIDDSFWLFSIGVNLDI